MDIKVKKLKSWQTDIKGMFSGEVAKAQGYSRLDADRQVTRIIVKDGKITQQDMNGWGWIPFGLNNLDSESLRNISKVALSLADAIDEDNKPDEKLDEQK